MQSYYRALLAKLMLLPLVEEFLEKATLNQLSLKVILVRQNTFRKLFKHVQNKYLSLKFSF